MKFEVVLSILLAIVFTLGEAGPVRLNKRAAFYIANETACVVDSIVYFNGEPIPTDDPCEACKCRPPGFACVLKECEVKPGCRAVRRAGFCCPEYVCGCEHNGRMYRDGDEIRDAKNPCFICHCQGTSIACAFIDCFFRVDCAPEYVPGECCPHYNSCIPINSNNPIPFVPHVHTSPFHNEHPMPITILPTAPQEHSSTHEAASTMENTSTEKEDEPNKTDEKDSTESVYYEDNERTSEKSYYTQETPESTSGTASTSETSVTEDQENKIVLNLAADLTPEESSHAQDEPDENVTIKDEEDTSTNLAYSTTTVPSSTETEPEKTELTTESTQKTTEVVHSTMVDEIIKVESRQKSFRFEDDKEEESSTTKTVTEKTEMMEIETETQSKETSTLMPTITSKVDATTESKQAEFLNVDALKEKSEESTEEEDSEKITEEYESETQTSTTKVVTEEYKEAASTNPSYPEEVEVVTVVVNVKDTEEPATETSKNSSTEPKPENFYKALDDAILQAFNPNSSKGLDESVDEKNELTTTTETHANPTEHSTENETKDPEPIEATTIVEVLTKLAEGSTKVPESTEMTTEINKMADNEDVTETSSAEA